MEKIRIKYFTDKIEKFVNSKIVTTPTKIFHAKAGNYAGMIGAVLLANDIISF